METLNIQTQRLQIRNLKTSDVDDFFVYRSNPAVTEYQGFDVMSLEQSADFIASQKEKLFGKPTEWVQYGLENLATNTIIGDCAIKLHEDPRIASIGISISHLYQKQGFAKEALQGILDFLFYQKKIHRVEEIVDADNIASIQLLKSLGFRLEGHFVENIFFKGKWGSEFQYAILRREWVDEPSSLDKNS